MIDISLQANGSVGGNIETVNGNISITDVTVNNDISTLNGDIDITGNSEIYGDIIYEHNESSWGNDKDKLPTLTIGKNVTLHGNIILKRRVELNVESADIDKKVVVSYDHAK